jgi:hypothetical protein
MGLWHNTYWRWRAPAIAILSVILIYGLLTSYAPVFVAALWMPDVKQLSNVVQDFAPGFSLPEYDDFAADVFGLKRRDVCTDVFPGRVSQTCSPSETLCCMLSNSIASSRRNSELLLTVGLSIGIIPGNTTISCKTILGFGFCCTEWVTPLTLMDVDVLCHQRNIADVKQERFVLRRPINRPMQYRKRGNMQYVPQLIHPLRDRKLTSSPTQSRQRMLPPIHHLRPGLQSILRSSPM